MIGGMGAKLVWHQTEVEKELYKELQARMHEAGKVVRDAAKAKVRISDDPHVFRGKTYAAGTLKKSISYRVFNKKEAFTASGEFNIDFKDTLILRIGTGVIYGVFQELGPKSDVRTVRTAHKFGKRNVETGKIVPVWKSARANRWKFNPFLRPAWLEKQWEVMAILGQDVSIYRQAGTEIKISRSGVYAVPQP